MNVFVEADPIRKIGASPGANVKANKVIAAQRPRSSVYSVMGQKPPFIETKSHSSSMAEREGDERSDQTSHREVKQLS